MALHLHGPGGDLGAEEGAAQVDLEHPVEVLVGEVEEGPIAQDAGVVHPDVDAAELGLGRPEDPVDPLAGGHGVVVRDGLAPLGLDLLHDAIGGLGGATAAVAVAAEVVHDDLRPGAASASAWARPMPAPAPVTTATLPSSSLAIDDLPVWGPAYAASPDGVKRPSGPPREEG